MTTTPADGATPATFPPTNPGAIVCDLELLSTTLDELGQVLPCSRRPYTFHAPNMGTMKRLGQLQADGELHRRPGQFVAFYLAAALATLGDVDMGPPTRDPKGANLVGQLPAGDVLTLLVAWTHAQHRRQGVEIGGAGCGACGATWERVRVRLGELEVYAVPEDYQGTPSARVGLWDGFTVHGRKVQAVIVQAPSWSESFGSLSKEGWANPTAIRAATIQGAIRSCDAMPKLGRLGVESLDELMPDDLALLDEALGKITPSVSLELSIDCPACGATNRTGMDWRNLGFSSGPARV